MPSKRISATSQISGDELFVPLPHSMIDDRELSHAAVRLWCMLHRLWFRRELPSMDCLQDVMGSWVVEKGVVRSGAQVKHWQPATRRSIERWLGELEAAGWLTWNRRADVTSRYHLHTSSGTRVQPYRYENIDDQGDREDTIQTSSAILASHDATSESYDATSRSYDAIPLSHGAIRGSHSTISPSQHATLPPHQPLVSGVPIPQNQPPYTEREEREDRKDSPSPSSQPTGGGEGPTDTERFLVRAGFSASTAREFRHLALPDVQRELAQRRAYGQGPGAMVKAWRVEPPTAPEEPLIMPPLAAARANMAKQQALQLAPPDATELEIQYLALDLEEGETPDAALAALLARRAHVPGQAAGALGGCYAQ